jgi:hypothetical protein
MRRVASNQCVLGKSGRGAGIFVGSAHFVSRRVVFATLIQNVGVFGLESLLRHHLCDTITIISMYYVG